MTTSAQQEQALGLRPGELVRVRSAAEIFSTLDAQSSLEGVPFMPEMLRYCGETLQVAQRADKTCAGDGAARRMQNAVHLRGIRCDGGAHGGCQAACLIFWKEAWLERAEAGAASAPDPSPDEREAIAANLLTGTRAAANGNAGSAPRYRCQATEVPRAARPLRFRELDQYVRDVRNWNLAKVIRGLAIQLFNLWQSFTARRFPPALRIYGGRPYPFIEGTLPVAKGATPRSRLDLKPGDLVRIKSKREIEATLDRAQKNRGLGFDGEMANYCGRTARVLKRVNRLVDERTGELIEIDSDCIVLDGIVCKGDYHLFCTRAIYPYWREIWLEPVERSGSGRDHEVAAGDVTASCTKLGVPS